jgi:hypothetical protein
VEPVFLVPPEEFFEFPQCHAKDGAPGYWKLQHRSSPQCASVSEWIKCSIPFVAFERCKHYGFGSQTDIDTRLKLREYSPESILSCVIVTLEQFSNFDIIDTHGIVISERFLYDFVRS